ncbi:glutamine synthetase family protein [uncultured Cocleimonas sp.]|uniref:glutamine synthetase family protein n=1 Tax=uncultured Cocleimonas sp. TaxID=1051587 RepID=UPI002610E234|nr:glutamine synthetase family protein [uncultured Cocleimonas sp.]
MTETKQLTFEALKSDVNDGIIDTVLVCLVDMQGRLMGKRFHAQSFVESAYQETHCCTYLLATDLEMATPDGYASTSWEAGYGDYVMKPDLSTLRYVPWLEGTAMVLCDVIDHSTHKPVPHSPREMLKGQIAKLASLGYTAYMATELEFFLFKESFEELANSNYKQMTPIGAYNEDYHIFQTTKEEGVMRPLRNHLYEMGIPVEGSKGEAEAGQEELNIKYDDALACADHHTIAKHATKEISWQQGHAVTFLPKWDHKRIGSSSHVHQSLWKDGNSIFFDEKCELGKSEIMDNYLAGLIAYATDYTYFMAPYVNSYKRFAKGSFAPTKIVWSVDNRTAAFRLCGAGSSAIRVECRVPGSDMNPYLAQSAMLAAGIKGIEEKMKLPPEFTGNVYKDSEAESIPGNLYKAIETLRASSMLKEAFGEEVVKHYVRCGEVEIEEFEKVVTDWEVKRGFERV